MQAWKEYQSKNKDRFLNELLELLTNTQHKCEERA
jgi:hypothetical protein